MMNEKHPVVNEYISRKRLAELGFTSDLSQLPSWKGNDFIFISNELDRLKEQDRKREARKSKSKTARRR